MAASKNTGEGKGQVQEFLFFKELLHAFQANESTIRGRLSQISRRFLAYNEDSGYLRAPQLEALKVYVFLKDYCRNEPLHEIFRKWHNKEDYFSDLAIYHELFRPTNEEDYKRIFKELSANSGGFPNYIFALTMGTGKTILMAVCIFYEFIMARKFGKDSRFCHNAVVFAPDTTVLQSLHEIKTFGQQRLVVPTEYQNFIATDIRFHFLTQAAATLATDDHSQFNIVVSNMQKIILRKESAEKSASQLLFSVEKDTVPQAAPTIHDRAAAVLDLDNVVPETPDDLTTNQRFQKLCRLDHLGVYIDEAHHAFGSSLSKDITRLRETVNRLSKETTLSGCYNFTGTPYVKGKILPEVVYAYSLHDAINTGLLKRAEVNSFSNVKTQEFVRQALKRFWEHNGTERAEGMLRKIAFFATTIQELTDELRPVVEKVMAELNIPPDRMLVNVGDDKLTTNDDIREFNNLDTTGSSKQVILLVNKGKEGWNCRSLFAVALFRSPKSKVFVLQATMRCLRSITDTQQIGRIFLSEENEQTLKKELEANHRLTLEEFQSVEEAEKIPVEVSQPLVTISFKRIHRDFSLNRKSPASLKEPIDFRLRDLDPAHYDAILRVSNSLQDGAPRERQVITEEIERTEYSAYTLTSELVRTIGYFELQKHFGSPGAFIEELLENSRDGMDTILEQVNRYNVLVQDRLIPTLIEYLFEVKTEDRYETLEIPLANKFEQGTREFRARPGMYVARDDLDVRQFAEKSFHLSHYVFHSKPEKQFFTDVIKRHDVKKVYFTGMLTHGQSDFRIPYIDPVTHTVRHYYPDFLVQSESGEWHIVEIKQDNLIEDQIVKAKQEYAEQMSAASKMEYSIISGTDALKGNYDARFRVLRHDLGLYDSRQ